MKMEAGYANSNSDSRHHAAAQLATRGNQLIDPEPPESVVFRSVGNLREEINGLSVQIDMLCSRLGSASKPVAHLAGNETAKPPEPVTSLLTKKIDDQAKRVRILCNQVATALDGLEL
jgi:hypothetical protein